MDVIARSIGGCVPIYDYQTAKEYAVLLLNAQVVVSLFAIVALEAGSDRLLRMYTIFVTGMWIMDVVWLALWGTHLHKASVSQQNSWRQTNGVPHLLAVLRPVSPPAPTLSHLPPR